MNKILIKNNCFLAHCFSADNVNGGFYERLKHAIDIKIKDPLSCSTIGVNDHAFKNYFGLVGLILKDPQVIYCNRGDGGTWSFFGDAEFGIYCPSEKDLTEAIIQRKSDEHNEFRLIKYNPIGIFLSKDEGHSHQLNRIIKSESNFHEQTKTHKLPYYFLNRGRLILCEYDPSLQMFEFRKDIVITELYK